MAILRRVEPRDRLLEIVDQLADAGVRVFEITFDAPAAADDLLAVRARLARHGGQACIIGAGTLTGSRRLALAREVGADFGVSPILDAPLVHEALDGGLPFVPGAMTPTEAITAWAAGATFVKLFPASVVGPRWIRELRGPLPDMQVIPSGGVDASNASEFLRAGAVAVGIGSALLDMDPEACRRLVTSVAGE